MYVRSNQKLLYVKKAALLLHLVLTIVVEVTEFHVSLFTSSTFLSKYNLMVILQMNQGGDGQNNNLKVMSTNNQVPDHTDSKPILTQHEHTLLSLSFSLWGLL